MRYTLILLLTAGCVTVMPDIDYTVPPPGDWPKLEEKIAYVEKTDIEKVCRGLGPNASAYWSCAVTSFRRDTCYIYLATHDPEVLKHERAHCAGYGHVGDPHAPAAAWENYKRAAR